MRTIKLTHEEIEMIKQSLQYVYDNSLKIIKENNKLLSEQARKEIITQANKVFDIQDVFDGERDV